MTTQNNKKTFVAYILLFAGVIAFAVMSFLPYAVISYDGVYTNFTGIFNAVLNLDGNDPVTVYRIISLAIMTLCSVALIVAALISFGFGTASLIKVLSKSGGMEAELDYMKENFYTVFRIASLSIVLCSALGTKSVAVWALAIFCVAGLIPAVIAYCEGEKAYAITIGATTIGITFLSASFGAEYNLYMLLDTVRPAINNVACAFTLLSAIALILLVFGEKRQAALVKANGVKAIIAVALSVVAIIIDIISGNMAGGQIAFGVIGVLLVVLTALVLNFADDSSSEAIKA